ncbi:MAG: hypothetical protein AAGK71_11755 [Pseudomonadota bacterium]
MAKKFSKWAIFLRAFFVSLLAMQPAKMGSAQSSEDQAWNSAVQSNTEQAYHDYLSQYPAGAYVRDAILALQRLGAIRGGVPTRGLKGEPSTASSGGSLY